MLRRGLRSVCSEFVTKEINVKYFLPLLFLLLTSCKTADPCLLYLMELKAAESSVETLSEAEKKALRERLLMSPARSACYAKPIG
jgi:hypothetical protein